MSQNEKFLVLGSNSFSGATFTNYVASAGYDVLATSRSPEPHDAFLPYKWQPHSGRISFKIVDINHDLDTLDEIIRRERPSHIVNFAAQSMVGESWQNPDHWMTTNVVSTIRLHERLRRYDGLVRYVHITTPEVYGSTNGWIGEDAPYNPSTPYAVSRAAADMSLRTYFNQYGFPVVFTRASNVFGPGQQLYRIIPRTIMSAIAGQKLQLHGGGQSVRSFIHMTDVADATLTIALHGRMGESYHISTKRMIKIRDIVAMILQRLNRDFDASVEVVGERAGKDSAYMLASDKLRLELGWHDRTSLEQGIDETIDWAQKYRGALEQQAQAYVHKE